MKEATNKKKKKMVLHGRSFSSSSRKSQVGRKLWCVWCARIDRTLRALLDARLTAFAYSLTHKTFHARIYLCMYYIYVYTIAALVQPILQYRSSQVFMGKPCPMPKPSSLSFVTPMQPLEPQKSFPELPSGDSSNNYLTDH